MRWCVWARRLFFVSGLCRWRFVLLLCVDLWMKCIHRSVGSGGLSTHNSTHIILVARDMGLYCPAWYIQQHNMWHGPCAQVWRRRAGPMRSR